MPRFLSMMTPLEAVAAMWLLKQRRPAEYRRLMKRWERAILAESKKPSPILAMLERRKKAKP